MNLLHNTLLLLSATAILLGGCSKTELDIPDNGDLRYSTHAIELSSQVAGTAIEGASQPQSRAVANPAQQMILHLVRADETGAGTNTYTSYGATVLNATRTAGTGAQALAFDTPQYYLASNVGSRLTGWFPTATSYASGVASWTINGSQDILTAAAKTGKYTSPIPALSFNHILSQLQFWFYAADAATQSDWGRITKIVVKAQPNTCKYTLSTGASTGTVTFASTPTADFTTTNLIAEVLPTTKKQMCDPVMIAPQSTATVVNLYLETSTGVKITVPLTTATYLPGKAYKISLKFVRKEITASATVSDWGGLTNVDVPVN